jgi:uncharacterized protein YkvS
VSKLTNKFKLEIDSFLNKCDDNSIILDYNIIQDFDDDTLKQNNVTDFKNQIKCLNSLKFRKNAIKCNCSLQLE